MREDEDCVGPCTGELAEMLVEALNQEKPDLSPTLWTLVHELQSGLESDRFWSRKRDQFIPDPPPYVPVPEPVVEGPATAIEYILGKRFVGDRLPPEEDDGEGDCEIPF